MLKSMINVAKTSFVINFINMSLISNINLYFKMFIRIKTYFYINKVFLYLNMYIFFI